MTSMPTSRARTAICSAPLEWPSSPGLATRIRSGGRSWRRHRPPSRERPPVVRRCRPRQSRRGRSGRGRARRRCAGPRPTRPSSHPPWRLRSSRGIRFADSSRAASARAVRAVSTAPASRPAFHSSSASIRSRSTSGSGVRMPPSSPTVRGESSLSVYEFCADHLEVAGLDPGEPVAMGLDQTGLHVGHRLARRRAAVLGDHGHLAAGAVHELLYEALLTTEPSKMSG